MVTDLKVVDRSDAKRLRIISQKGSDHDDHGGHDDPLEKDTCQTYAIFKDDQDNDFYVGCAIAENDCQPLKSCNPQWPNFYTARITGTVN